MCAGLSTTNQYKHTISKKIVRYPLVANMFFLSSSSFAIFQVWVQNTSGLFSTSEWAFPKMHKAASTPKGQGQVTASIVMPSTLNTPFTLPVYQKMMYIFFK